MGNICARWCEKEEAEGNRRASPLIIKKLLSSSHIQSARDLVIVCTLCLHCVLYCKHKTIAVHFWRRSHGQLRQA